MAMYVRSELHARNCVQLNVWCFALLLITGRGQLGNKCGRARFAARSAYGIAHDERRLAMYEGG